MKSIEVLEKEAAKLEKLISKLGCTAKKVRPLQSWRDREHPPQKEIDKNIEVLSTKETNLLELVRMCLGIEGSTSGKYVTTGLEQLEKFNIAVEETGCDECGAYTFPKLTVSKFERANNSSTK